jgi:hypothetical protein
MARVAGASLLIEAIGYVGAAGAASMWMPQMVRAIRNRRDHDALHGLSLGGYAVAIVFNALLIAYSATTAARPALVAGIVNLVCAFVIVAFVLPSRLRR